MIADHYEQTRDRLRAHPKLANKVDEAARQKSGKPVAANYLILFPPYIDALDDERYAKGQDVSSRTVFRYDAKAVAVDPSGCIAIVEATLQQLIGWAPTIAGRRCDPFELDLADKVRPDTSVEPPLFYCDLEFEAVSDRA